MRKNRQSKGQAIVEGVVALALIVAATVGAIVFLVNSSMAAFYKQKLGIVTWQAAQYAYGQPSATAEEATKTFTKALMQQMNLGTSTPQITVAPLQISGQNAMSVTISDSFPLFGKNTNIFGANISLSDTSVATTSSSGGGGSGGGSPNFLITVPGTSASASSGQNLGNGMNYYIPAYQVGAGAQFLPQGSLSSLGESLPELPASLSNLPNRPLSLDYHAGGNGLRGVAIREGHF